MALDEMLRVTRSGGQVLVVDIDWATLSIECGEPGTVRRLVRQRCESALPNPCAGRRLPGLLRRCRLQDMQAEVWPLWTTEPALAEIIAQVGDSRTKPWPPVPSTPTSWVAGTRA